MGNKLKTIYEKIVNKLFKNHNVTIFGATNANIKKKIKILVDNGHGENTPGKYSPVKEDGTRYYEWKHTRVMAKMIVDELVRLGYDAELIVTEKWDVSLAERARRINNICSKYGTANVMVVSVHTNAAGNGGWMNARGWCIYTSPGKTKSDDIATSIYLAMEQSLKAHNYYDTFTQADYNRKQKPLRSDFTDGDPDYEAKFYMLTKTKCPAVLSENLFHDNKEDLKYLESTNGVHAIVEGHVNGIVNYINSLK